MIDKYAVLIIDLKKSREYTKEDRINIQYYIMDIIELLNRRYSQYIIRDVDFSAGDEFQGLFASPEAAYLYYRMISMWLHPIEIRAGIGVGGWDVQINDKGTTSQDGSAYHNARKAINNADDTEGYPILFFSNSHSDITINTIIGGAASIMEKQSIYQNQLMLLTELLFPIFSFNAHAYDYTTLYNIEHFLKKKALFLQDSDRYARPLPIDRLRCSIIEKIEPISVMDIWEKTFYITSGKQRGIPTKLASVVHISRQTIEKALKAGNIYTARNMAISALLEMKCIR